MESTFEKHVLQLKKDKVIEVVSRICKKRNLPPPAINFGYCPNEGQDELAHYHPDENKICISKTQLIKHNLDELEYTVAHEVSHILVQDHSPEFYRQDEISRISAWKPPYGKINTEYEKSTAPADKSKIDKTHCNYHLCRKKTILKQCRLCKKFFCKTHVKAKQIGLPRFNDTSKEADKFRESWHKDDGHPCGGFIKILERRERQQKLKDARYKEALDSLLGKANKRDKHISNAAIGELNKLTFGSEDSDEEFRRIALNKVKKKGSVDVGELFYKTMRDSPSEISDTSEKEEAHKKENKNFFKSVISKIGKFFRS
jgi:hypothetical protein